LRSSVAIVFTSHCLQGSALHQLYFVHDTPPFVAAVAAAVDESGGDVVIQAGGAIEASAPLGGEAQEELYDGPVFGPDFDGVEGVVVGGEAGARQLCS
jgi:hypothetical protein